MAVVLPVETLGAYLNRGEATEVSYWIRVSDSAYQESGPAEICDFMAQGFTPDIRIMAVR